LNITLIGGKNMSNEQEMHTLKTGSCESLSGQSTLTYQIACKDKEIYISLTGNSGKGIFNKNWSSLKGYEVYG
jgi:hypothetical protein